MQFLCTRCVSINSARCFTLPFQLLLLRLVFLYNFSFSQHLHLLRLVVIISFRHGVEWRHNTVVLESFGGSERISIFMSSKKKLKNILALKFHLLIALRFKNVLKSHLIFNFNTQLLNQPQHFPQTKPN